MNSFSETETQVAPLVRELVPAPDVAAAFRAIASRPRVVLFDSALRHGELGRYSFLMADPFDYLELHGEIQDPLAEIQRRHGRYRSAHVDGLPPFQGGAAGVLSYELGRCYENVPAAKHDEFQLPLAAIGWYDVTLAWDHREGRAWIISHGWPQHDATARAQRAAARADEIESWLANPSSTSQTSTSLRIIPPTALAPQCDPGRMPKLTSNFSHEAYLDAARQAIEFIHAGDVFQVNLAQRLLQPDDGDPVGLYLRLRTKNPATFAGYFTGSDFVVASASPERFVRVQQGQVETRPIKGTRQRNRLPEADLFTGDALQASEKDRAENIMIVDLLRNDLSRVCDADSVRVDSLCRLEVYETVQHLVSVITGELRADCSPLDVLRCSFPGGSITGAPKVRAMEIIANLESTARGAYCGSMGYIGFDGTMDWNILIRTITIAGGWRQIPVGGGIVAQSDPQAEYEETWHKAEGMLRAL